MDIYLLIEGKQEGPYSEEQVRQSLASGQIPSDLPAWHEGLTEWMPVSSILPSHPSGPQVPPPLVPAPSLTRTDAPLIVPDESSEREFVSYLWYRSSVIVSLAIFIPFIMGPLLAILVKPFMIAALIAVATGPIYYRKNGVLKTWPRPRLQRWLAITLLVFFVPYYLLLVFQSLGSSSMLSGVYRTPDGKKSLTIISDSEVDITTTDGTFPGHYEKKGDKYRMIVTILGTQQVFYFKLVKDGVEEQSGALYLSPSYYSVAQLYYSGKDKAINGDLDGAISDFNQVIETFPHYSDAYFQRGEAENKKNEDDAAIADYKKALELDPKSDASNKLDEIQGDVMRKKEEQIKAALSGVAPKTADQPSPDLSTRSEDEQKKTLQQLQQAVQDSPNDASAGLRLGIAYFQLGQYDHAIDALNIAKSLDDTNPQIHNYLACALSKKGWNEVAEKEFRRAIELDPKSQDAHFNLALVYANEQPPSLELARQEYQKALDLGANRNDQLDSILK